MSVPPNWSDSTVTGQGCPLTSNSGSRVVSVVKLQKIQGWYCIAIWATILASRTNEILAIDFTLLEPSLGGLKNVLIMTDVFSKYTVAVATWDQRASTIAQVLVTERFFKFGVPSCIHFD